MKELDKTMYFRAKPGTLETARLLRKNMTFLKFYYGRGFKVSN